MHDGEIPEQPRAALHAGFQQRAGSDLQAVLVVVDRLAAVARSQFPGQTHGSGVAEAESRYGFGDRHGRIPPWIRGSAAQRAERVSELGFIDGAATARFGVGAVPLRPQVGERQAACGGDTHLDPLAARDAFDDLVHLRWRTPTTLPRDVCLRDTSQLQDGFDDGWLHVTS